MKSEKSIRMTFICNQNWDAMKPTPHGRFCELCKKEVIDYTSKDLNTIQKSRSEGQNDLCGRFSVEQVDTSLIKPISLPKPIKHFAFLSTLMIIITSKTSFSQTTDTVKTEQLTPQTNVDSNATASTGSSVGNDISSEKNFEGKSPLLTTKKKRYYWTRRFPFIKRVKIKAHYQPLTGRYL